MSLPLCDHENEGKEGEGEILSFLFPHFFGTEKKIFSWRGRKKKKKKKKYPLVVSSDREED